MNWICIQLCAVNGDEVDRFVVLPRDSKHFPYQITAEMKDGRKIECGIYESKSKAVVDLEKSFSKKGVSHE